jgi:DNA-binding beta-propeller fold protein YncE
MSLINGFTDRIIGTVAVGAGPGGIAISARTHASYVANLAGNTVTEIG